ncbi:lipid IV(A) 4-amino-4-deoxy-L-arabinosyltransferase [Serratia microhaemolytica]|uniref:lipid IV(A) 4-amino-4-deoxy-L-arabinosyltransferase n=1 Tax=Serratia microhaemolytica TaxID=2675110 RepID=UPI000FDE0F2B|nr:lipid IV(A) 4-amino-4-deoxy-L-arabinosyltransferase [Serratia microhaemolytica]
MKLLKSGWLWLVAAFFLLAYLLPLNSRLLWQPDETRYAEISREMLARGDWLVPHLMGLRYFEKPVAGYWLNNIGQWLFGDSNFAVRFAAVLTTGLSALLVFVLAWLMWRSVRRGLLAMLIFLSMLLVVGTGSYSTLDPMFSLWLTAAMVSYYLALKACTVKGRITAYLLLGLACGLGFMTKGFLALALPVLAALPIAIQQRKLKAVFCYGGIALLAALLVSLPWALAIAAREPDYWHYFFWVEHIQRFSGSDAQHKAPFWYYLPVLMAGVLPWLALLPGALLSGWRQRQQQPELFFLFCWVAMPLIFFSIASGKLLTYILPCMAPLALLIAHYAQHCQQRVLVLNGIVNALFATLVMVLLLLSSSGLLPSLVLFAADEWSKLLRVLLIFIAWLLFALLANRDAAKRWPWAAACPLMLCLLLGHSIPQQIIDAKLPQHFIQSQLPLLSDSRYLLSNNVGTAAALGWQLKRSDILMFSQRGELAYGLSYVDSNSHYITDKAFEKWLAQARQQGSVALVLQLRNRQPLPAGLPAADQIHQRHRLVLLWYGQQP